MTVKWENSIVSMKLALIGYLSLVANTESTSGDQTEPTSIPGIGMTDSESHSIAREYVLGNLQVERAEDGGMPSPDTGLYLMSQEALSTGWIRGLQACGFKLNSVPNYLTDLSLIFFVASYKLVGNYYVRHTDASPFELTVNTTSTDSFGCGNFDIPFDVLREAKGDKTGVFVQRGNCNTRAINSLEYTCPAHVNMVDSPSNNCSQALYFNSTRNNEMMPDRISVADGNPVNVFINMNITIETDVPVDPELLSPMCAEKNNYATLDTVNDNVVLIATMTAIGVVLIFIVIIVLTLIAAYFCWKRRVKMQDINFAKKNNLQSWLHHHDHEHQQPSTDILTNNEYSTEGQAAILQVSEDHYETDSNFPGEQQLKGGDYDYADLEQFWEPADQESGLKEQLFRLNIQQIQIEDLVLEDNVLRIIIKAKFLIKEQLGCGKFTTVHHGVWRSPRLHDSFKDVAVKCLKGEASEEERINFLQEAAIMGQFDHPNILQMLSLSYDEDMKPILIVDLMHIGDLHHHLQSLRPKEGQKASHKLGPTLLSFSRQVAFGMHYLSCKNYVHRDVAARNVLVAKGGICKIANFGVPSRPLPQFVQQSAIDLPTVQCKLPRALNLSESEDLQNKDYYISQGGKVPVKWTAPEALHYQNYSTASDVWSYGCLLYEIWSLGCKPFSTFTNAEVVRQVGSGYRLPPPPGCPKAIYTIMIQCWDPNPDVRVSFLTIVMALQHPDYKILSWSPEDTDGLSENAQRLGAPLADSESLYKTLQCTYIH